MKASDTLTIRESGRRKKGLRGYPNNGAPGRTVKGIAKEALLKSMVHLAKSYGLDRVKLNLGSNDSSTYVPAAIGRTITSTLPRTTRSKTGTVCVAHRELIDGSIGYSSSFEVQNSFFLQPGDKNTFPWLSIQAAQYEQYRFKRLSFTFVPIVGTSVAGDVMLLADYNVQDPPPVSEQDALDHPGARTGSVWESHMFKCDISKMHALGPRKFIRTSAVAGDPKTYDCGQFHICTNNISVVSAAIGKLFVDYEVEFFVPQLNPRTENSPTVTSYFDYNTSQPIVSGVEKLVSFGRINGWDPLRIFPLSSSVEAVFTPPAGCYRIYFSANLKVTINALNSYQIYFLKDGAISPAAIFSDGYINPFSSLAQHEAILSFNGDETLAVALVVTAAASGTLSLNEAMLILSLA